jgi:spore germination cell wall hydrolase CwlJ-like protein
MVKLTTITRMLSIVLGISVVISSVQLALLHRTQEERFIDKDETARFIENQLSCLAKNIYWEAANEPFEGKVAVAQVTLNRVRSDDFADSVCGVVYQKNTFNKKTVCQFSWYCERNHLVKRVHESLYKESMEVAKMVYLEGFKLKVIDNALYYHADYVNPGWKKQKITKIGRHIFYA